MDGRGARGGLLVLVVVDVVHQRHELRDGVVELDVLVLLLLDPLDLHAQRHDPLDVLVVVGRVEPRRRHVLPDELPCPGQELPRHGPAQVHAGLPPLLLFLRPPLLRVGHHVARLVPRQRLHPEALLVAGLHDPRRLPAQAADGAPHGAVVDQEAAGGLEELAHVLDVGVGPVGEVEAEALLVVRGDLGGPAGAGGALFLGQPDLAAVVVELLHRAGFLVRDGVRGHDGFDVVARG